MWVSLFDYKNESGEPTSTTPVIHYNLPQFFLKDEIFNNIFSHQKENKTSPKEASFPALRAASTSPFVVEHLPSMAGPGSDNEYTPNSTDFRHSFYEKSWEDILIVSTYGILFLVGVVGNVSVMVAICRRGGAGQPQPHRHSLILSLAIADLLISLLCYPLNVIPLIMPFLQVPFPVCHILVTMQGALQTSSTFSMAFLALDRYMIVRKPKMAPKVARWMPHLLGGLWVCALLLAIPRGLMVPFAGYSNLSCTMKVMNNDNISLKRLSIVYFCFISFFLYVLPCIIVCYCHFLVASSLRKRGLEETRLEQRPRQVIIVARDCSAAGNTTHKIVAATSSLENSDDGNEPPEPATKSEKLKKRFKTTKMFASHTSQASIRPSKSVKTIIRAHRRLRVRRKVRSASLLTDHRSHSIETRMRLAKLLVILAILFTICWLPYACTLAVWTFVEGNTVNIAITTCLLVGYCHSAISPIVYWIMNRSILTSVHRLVSSYLHWPTSSEPLLCGACPRPKCMKPIQSNWGNNSSTNEEALGPFHPKYVNPLALRPQPSRCTSHYFH